MSRLLPQCEQMVSEAMGRKIKPSESENVIPAIRSQYAQRMKNDPEFKRMTHAERLRAAAEDAAALINATAKAKRNRAALQVLAVEKNLNICRNLGEKGFVGRGAVAERLEQIDNRVKAVRQESFGKMIDGLKPLAEGKFFGLIEDRSKALDVVRALYGEKIQDADLAKGAAVISEGLEDLRVRYNKLGGDIKKLEDYVLPQSHDLFKVARASEILATRGQNWVVRKARLGAGVLRRFGRNGGANMEEQRSAWVDFIADKLDRDKYVDLETGSRLDDVAYREMLERAYDTIVTDGAHDAVGPTAMSVLARKGGKGKRGDKHRSLHFKDAESWMTYEEVFGNGNVGMTITSHVNSMAREIALMQELGPNPNATFEVLKGTADREAQNARLTHGMEGVSRRYKDWNGTLPVTLESLWANLSGVTSVVSGIGYNAGAAQFMRTLQCGGKLGQAFISSFSDVGTYFATAHVNGVPLMRAVKGLVRGWGKHNIEEAQRLGILADTVNASLARWGEENIGTGLINTMTEATMRLSLLESWTNGVRRAMGYLMMDTLNRMRRNQWGELDAMDRARLEEAGFTEKDWVILQHAEERRLDGQALLAANDVDFDIMQRISPEVVKAFDITQMDVDDARTKLLGFYYQEMHIASLDPNLRTRAAANWGMARGTVLGEIARSLMLFKSFPLGMTSAHFRRASQYWRNGRKGSAVAYTGAIVASTTLFGALSLQAANLVGGRDLQDMEAADFWTNAFLKGGGLGFYGDILYNGLIGENKYGAPNWVGFAGPVFGTFFDAVDTYKAYRDTAISDKETRAEARLIRLLRSNTPIINTWYLRGILDRAVFNDLNEQASPGYLHRQSQRMRKSTGQEFWWGPHVVPERLPKMATQPN